MNSPDATVVPDFVFDTAWQKAGFVVHEDSSVRFEVRQRYEYYLHSGTMHIANDANAKMALLARIAAIEAYDAVLFRAKAQKNRSG